EQRLELPPDALGALGRRRQERVVPVVGRVVLLDEVANVDLGLPEALSKPLPGRGGGVRGLRYRCGRNHAVLLRTLPAWCGRRPVPATGPCGARSSAPRWSGSPRPTPGCWRGGPARRGSHSDASQIRWRIADEFSPMPAVKTRPSRPPRTAVRAPISLA